MMGYGGYGYRMMGSGLGWLMMFGILILIALAVFVAVRLLHRANQTDNRINQSHAIDILNERYAKGEMTDEEYKRKKADIRG